MTKGFNEKDGKLLEFGILACMSINNDPINYTGAQRPPENNTWFKAAIEGDLIPSLQNTIQNSGYDFIDNYYKKQFTQE